MFLHRPPKTNRKCVKCGARHRRATASPGRSARAGKLALAVRQAVVPCGPVSKLVVELSVSLPNGTTFVGWAVPRHHTTHTPEEDGASLRSIQTGEIIRRHHAALTLPARALRPEVHDVHLLPPDVDGLGEGQRAAAHLPGDTHRCVWEHRPPNGEGLWPMPRPRLCIDLLERSDDFENDRGFGVRSQPAVRPPPQVTRRCVPALSRPVRQPLWGGRCRATTPHIHPKQKAHLCNVLAAVARGLQCGRLKLRRPYKSSEAGPDSATCPEFSPGGTCRTRTHRPWPMGARLAWIPVYPEAEGIVLVLLEDLGARRPRTRCRGD
eukprot:gene24364-biopygen13441